ncbi:MAG: ABC transporter substrate-binding protein [Chloroflexi bacterium]|nr:ABC transporter substrate-binding protein [Chloroflexota bacterium]
MILTDPLSAFPNRPPQRVVSLVPSDTASLFDLGLGDCLVAVTSYCKPPAGRTAALAVAGGPKNPAVEQITALKPDLVIANREENDRQSIERLSEAGVPVWLSFPKTVREAVDHLWSIARLFRCDSAAVRVRLLEQSLEWAEMAAQDNPPVRYFCPIWEDRLETGERWWMTFNEQTYSNDVLRIFNGMNVFAGRERRYPLLAELGHAAADDTAGRDTRYPRVGVKEIIAAAPEVILLPDEPYSYSHDDAERMKDIFARTPAGEAGRIYPIDGTLITWYGTRIGKALETIPDLFNSR